MKVRDIMSRDVETIAPDDTIQIAAEKMRAFDVGPLPVCDGQRVVGIVTDRDITIRATSDGRDPHSTSVREVMTEDVTYCFDDQDVAEAAQMMRDKQIRRLIVLDRSKRLVGIVALGDVAVDAGDSAQSEKALKGVSQPS